MPNVYTVFCVSVTAILFNYKILKRLTEPVRG